MKHAVLGMGAIGGLMATALSSVGEEVTGVVRREKVAGFPRRISLEQPGGSVAGEVRAVATLDNSVDVLWIATKTYQLESALEHITTAPNAILPLLNGIDHVAALRARFGDDRVLPATIAVEAERAAEGRYVQRSALRLNLSAKAEPLLGAIVARLEERLGFSCKFFDNEQTLLWTKLCFLAPFALATSASGKDKGGIFADAAWKAKLYSAIEEASAVANASGAEVDAAKLQGIFENAPATMRSSMAKDLIAGRRLELDDIAGPIIRGGAEHNIPVPTILELANAVRVRSAAQHA